MGTNLLSGLPALLLRIDKDTPGLELRTDFSPQSKYNIFYYWPGDLKNEDGGINIVLDEPLMVEHSICAKGDLTAKLDVWAGQDIVCAGDITTPANIDAGSSIIAMFDIEAANIYAKSKGITANGRIHAKGSVYARESIIADGGIEANGSIESKTQSILTNASIKAGMDIQAWQGYISATNGKIQAQRNINAQMIDAGQEITAVRGDIYSFTSICTKYGAIRARNIRAAFNIMAGASITAVEAVECGQRIFAGISPLTGTKDCDYIIRCKKLLNGTLCYGGLILTQPSEERN